MRHTRRDSTESACMEICFRFAAFFVLMQKLCVPPKVGNKISAALDCVKVR